MLLPLLFPPPRSLLLLVCSKPCMSKHEMKMKIGGAAPQQHPSLWSIRCASETPMLLSFVSPLYVTCVFRFLSAPFFSICPLFLLVIFPFIRAFSQFMHANVRSMKSFVPGLKMRIYECKSDSYFPNCRSQAV